METAEKPKGKSVKRKEKWLTIILVILAICVLALLIAVIVLATRKDEKEKRPDSRSEPPCLSDACLDAAVAMKYKMDEDAKPCDDFWKYACGEYIEKHQVLPFETEAVYSAIHQLTKTANKRLMTLLVEEDTKDTISPVNKIKKFFNTCIDPDINENVTMQELMNAAVTFGGIPIVTGSMNTNISRIELFTNFAKHFATFPFITMDVGRNFHSGKGNILYLMLTPTQEPNIMTNIIETIAKELNQTNSYNITEITDFMNIYKALADSLTPVDSEVLIQTKPRNISQILPNFPDFDLKSYINGMLNIGDTKLKNDSAIAIFDEELVKNFTSLVSNTSLETLLNIMTATSIIEIQSIVEPPTTGVKIHGENLNTDKSRANHCLQQCKNSAPRVLGKMYVEKYFPDKNLKQAEEIAKYTGEALIEVLKETDWLDEQSKKAVLDKAEELLKRQTIGYDRSLIADEYLIKKFENVTVNDNFYNNIFEYHKNSLIMRMKKFDKDDSKNTAVINSYMVNAQNSHRHNRISISAAILQPPFFTVDAPKEINFGGIGTVIAHELMHAFENSGIEFDKNGNIGNILTNSSQQKFDAEKDKLIKEYDSFVMPRVNETVNGTLTVGENIPDLSGMEVAYRAYKNWAKDNPKRMFPGLELSRDQLFFTSFTQIWCAIRSKKLLRDQLKTDVHSPAKARTMVTLQNFEEFSEAFNCKENSKMNPKDKIVIWGK